MQKLNRTSALRSKPRGAERRRPAAALAARLLVAVVCVAVVRAAVAEESVQTWRIGLVIEAAGGSASGIVASAPVPMEWPEQSVELVRQEQSPAVQRVTFRMLDGTVRQMVVSVPRLQSGEQARAIGVYRIRKRDVSPPEDPEQLRLPKQIDHELRRYLIPSPYIESDDPRIAKLAAEIASGIESPYLRARAFYDWVRREVRYQFDPTARSCLAALDAGHGDCEELTSLFIALCRAGGIPARAVWVPGHCYPEFYLDDAQGRGHWIPCQIAGAGQPFGSVSESRPILQKGDRFRVPGHRQPLRYVQATLTARNVAAPPRLTWVMERVPDETPADAPTNR